MVALPNDFWPRGDVISQRIIAVKKSIRQNRADYVFQTRAEMHREQRRPLLLDEFVPVMPWLLKQEALYRKVAKSQPAAHKSQPEYHVYHLSWGELPYTRVGIILWRVVSVVGNLYDCFLAAWRYSH